MADGGVVCGSGYHWIELNIRPSRVDTNFWERGFFNHTTIGKFAHNYLAFAFMVGLALSFVLWARIIFQIN